ncbi:uncharacterized protein LOC141866716 isoform X2 [Acropora palmata]|uniref:uncharacterized protein LOC141866716 isoform X2 n=1 Tax=Acropora palmata TaxID=6131 RepID=UPI003DA1AB5A
MVEIREHFQLMFLLSIFPNILENHMLKKESLYGTRSVTFFQSNDVRPHLTLMSPGRHLDLFILSDPWTVVGRVHAMFPFRNLLWQQRHFKKKRRLKTGWANCLLHEMERAASGSPLFVEYT